MSYLKIFAPKILSLLIILSLTIFLVGCQKQKPSSLSPQKNLSEPTQKKTLTTSSKEVTPTGEEKTEEGVKITLYFADKEARGLIKEVRTVPTTQAVAKTALIELIKGPQESDAVSLIPPGTKLISINIKDGTAFVDFSREFETNYPAGSSGENLLIYSIVNTLTEFPSIKGVRLLVEGRTPQVPSSNYDLSQTFERDESLIMP